MPNPKPVKIKAKAGVVSADPDRVIIFEIEDEAVWSCDDGDLEILFDTNDGTPFQERRFSARKGKSVGSREPLKGTARQRPYKYTATVTVNGKPVSKDPDVKVE